MGRLLSSSRVQPSRSWVVVDQLEDKVCNVIVGGMVTIVGASSKAAHSSGHCS